MTILIKDPETDRLVRELADRTGETITDAVRRAAFERLQRVPMNEDEIARRRRRIGEIQAYFETLPRANAHLSDDEILGYNDEGHFD